MSALLNATGNEYILHPTPICMQDGHDGKDGRDSHSGWLQRQITWQPRRLALAHCGQVQQRVCRPITDQSSVGCFYPLPHAHLDAAHRSMRTTHSAARRRRLPPQPRSGGRWSWPYRTPTPPLSGWRWTSATRTATRCSAPSVPPHSLRHRLALGCSVPGTSAFPVPDEVCFIFLDSLDVHAVMTVSLLRCVFALSSHLIFL